MVSGYHVRNGKANADKGSNAGNGSRAREWGHKPYETRRSLRTHPHCYIRDGPHVSLHTDAMSYRLLSRAICGKRNKGGRSVQIRDVSGRAGARARK